MRVTIYATFAQKILYILFKTTTNEIQLKVIKFNSVNLVIELLYLVRNYRRLIPDIIENIVIKK
jgi:hypothetical protein